MFSGEAPTVQPLETLRCRSRCRLIRPTGGFKVGPVDPLPIWKVFSVRAVGEEE